MGARNAVDSVDIVPVDARDEILGVLNAMREEDVTAPPGSREAVDRCREDGDGKREGVRDSTPPRRTGYLTVSGAEDSVAGTEVSGAAGFRALALRALVSVLRPRNGCIPNSSIFSLSLPK